MHIAETREQAEADVKFGLQKWLYYFQEIAALPLAPAGSVENAIGALRGSGLAVIGTPDDAAAQLERLAQQSGGYGCFLFMDHNWADWPRKQRSYELFARYVAPRFQRLNAQREASMGWAAANRMTFMGAVGNAMNQEMQKHFADVKRRKEEGAAG
jgi:limonene 1,2-monooxygenase